MLHDPMPLIAPNVPIAAITGRTRVLPRNGGTDRKRPSAGRRTMDMWVERDAEKRVSRSPVGAAGTATSDGEDR